MCLVGMDEVSGFRLARWAAACAGVELPTQREDGGPRLLDMTDPITIAEYLLERGGERSEVRPRTPRVTELLEYDRDCLAVRVAAFTRPVLTGEGEMPALDGPEAGALRESMKFVAGALVGHDFLTGSVPTLADLAFCSTLTSLVAVPAPVVDLSRHPGIIQWMMRCRGLGGGAYGVICEPFLLYAQKRIEAFGLTRPL